MVSLLLFICRLALRIFFRRLEIVGSERVPEGKVMFALNHPNGLVDPALVFVALPRKISFLAKSTLFRMPFISFLLRTVDALPLYRKMDAGEDVSKNQKTFELCRDLLQKGGSIALFPEGVSHNSPRLLPAKTGAARIALGAVSLDSSGEPLDLRIVPVGLFYTSKTTFRSEALLHCGEPFRVAPVTLDDNGHPEREAVRALTSQIEEALREVTLNAESESDLHTARLAEEIFSATDYNASLGNKLEFLRSFVANSSKESGGTKDRELVGKIVEYDGKLNDFGIEPEHLSLAQFRRRSVVRQAFLQTWPLILLAPFSLIGAVVHYPAYRLCGWIAKRLSGRDAEDIASTVKVLAGMVFFPVTWSVVAGVAFYFWGWEAALISLPASIVSGYAALYSQERMIELRGWARAIWLFLTRREAFLRMFVERRELQNELSEFD